MLCFINKLNKVFISEFFWADAVCVKSYKSVSRGDILRAPCSMSFRITYRHPSCWSQKRFCWYILRDRVPQCVILFLGVRSTPYFLFRTFLKKSDQGVGEDNGVPVSSSSGAKFWFLWTGVCIMWAAIVVFGELDYGSASLVFERGYVDSARNSESLHSLAQIASLQASSAQFLATWHWIHRLSFVQPRSLLSPLPQLEGGVK